MLDLGRSLAFAIPCAITLKEGYGTRRRQGLIANK